MENGNVLLLPFFFAGGYVFLQRCHYFRFRWAALAWERNIFEAAVAGGGLFALARAAVFISSKCPFCLSAQGLAKIILPFPFAGSFIAELALALLSAAIINDWLPPLAAVQLAVRNHGGALFDLLQRAASAASPVMLSMRDRKVYVGLVLRPPGPGNLYMRMIPTVSGYRMQRTMRVRFTTYYPSVYVDPPERERIEKLEVILPVAEIVSARLFDDETYAKYFAVKSSETVPAARNRETRHASTSEE